LLGLAEVGEVEENAVREGDPGMGQGLGTGRDVRLQGIVIERLIRAVERVPGIAGDRLIGVAVKVAGKSFCMAGGSNCERGGILLSSSPIPSWENLRLR
jgi:hypothetical protein